MATEGDDGLMKAATPVEADEPILRALDRWWFGYGSPTTLGVFRILIGSLAFLNLLMLTADWGAWFGENGFMPAWLGQVTIGRAQATGLGFEIPRLDLISGVTNPVVAQGFFAVVTVAALLTALGLWTRAAAFALAIGLTSLHHRDTSILHGGDTAMRIAVIYLAVSPCGRACSLDRLFRLRKGEETGPVEVPLYGQRLVEFNIALIYFTTVWAKTWGPKWMSGTATYYPARLAEFFRFPVPHFANDLPMVYLTTYGTLLTEFALGTLVFFRPIRKYILFAGVMLHGFIEYSMNIPLFSFLMVSGYVCFFEGAEIADYFRRMGDRLRPIMGLEVVLPAGRRFSERGERFLLALDPFGFVRYLPGDAEAWQVRKDNGKPAHYVRGVGYRAPGAWLFMLVPTLWRRVYLGCLEAV